MSEKREWKTTATVTEPERKMFWESIFDSDTVPIESILPTCVSVPGRSDVNAYMLDLDAITEEQRGRLVAGLAQKFGLDEAFVEAEIDRQGVPILCEHVMMMCTDYVQIASLMDDEYIAEPPDPDVCINCGCPGRNVQGGEYECPECGNIWDIYEPAPEVPSDGERRFYHRSGEMLELPWEPE